MKDKTVNSIMIVLFGLAMLFLGLALGFMWGTGQL